MRVGATTQEVTSSSHLSSPSHPSYWITSLPMTDEKSSDIGIVEDAGSLGLAEDSQRPPSHLEKARAFFKRYGIETTG